jgi:hypothetical protein
VFCRGGGGTPRKKVVSIRETSETLIGKLLKAAFIVPAAVLSGAALKEDSHCAAGKCTHAKRIKGQVSRGRR